VEHLLAQQRAAIDLLNANTEKLMAGTKELYAAAEAHGEANIKVQEDISKQAIDIAHREQAMAEREQAVQEKEEENASMLDRERIELSSHETDLNSCEAALEEDQKSLAHLRVEVLDHELATNLKANHLSFRERELADIEKQLPVTLPQELAAVGAHKTPISCTNISSKPYICLGY
jgi:hypothetical protein